MASNSESDLFEELLESNHKFARDVYHILAKQKENVIFSPISLQLTLLMALSGARGKTAEEMKTSLDLWKEKDELLQGTDLLLKKLKDPNLKIASQLFIGQQYDIKSTYKNSVKKYLECCFETVDFMRSPKEAARRINSWVSEKTENEISDIVDPDTLDEDTCVMLANAVYFKDEWEFKFLKEETYDEPFYSFGNSFHNIPMMHTTKCLRSLEEESYKVVEIPYKNSNFCLLIILPKEIEGLSQLEKKLQKLEFCKMLYNLSYSRVTLTLPKFGMEQLIDNMGTVLRKLGMKTMFDSDAADFTEIYNNRAAGDNLYVSSVCHKAVLEIDEEGTKASAFTCGKLRGGGPPPKEVIFKVDHPFIFLILHRSTILFMGKKSSFV